MTLQKNIILNIKVWEKNSIPQFQSNIDELFNKIKSGIEIIEELLGVNAFKSMTQLRINIILE